MRAQSDDDRAEGREPVVGHPYGGVEKPPPGDSLPGEEELGGDDVPESMRGIRPPGERGPDSEHPHRPA